jgi:hypothetical protein
VDPSSDDDIEMTQADRKVVPVEVPRKEDRPFVYIKDYLTSKPTAGRSTRVRAILQDVVGLFPTGLQVLLDDGANVSPLEAVFSNSCFERQFKMKVSSLSSGSESQKMMCMESLQQGVRKLDGIFTLQHNERNPEVPVISRLEPFTGQQARALLKRIKAAQEVF